MDIRDKIRQQLADGHHFVAPTALHNPRLSVFTRNSSCPQVFKWQMLSLPNQRFRMKTPCLAVFLAVGALALSAAAQDTNDLNTAIGRFENTRDTIIAHGFGEIGSIPLNQGEVQVRIRESQNLATAEKLYGLTVAWETKNAGHLRILVDEDELDALANAVSSLTTMTTEEVTTLTGFEASFTTKAGLRVIAHSDRRGGAVLTYLQFEDFPRTALSSVQLQQLGTLLQQGRKNIDALKAGK
jgi:hypothetical protein